MQVQCRGFEAASFNVDSYRAPNHPSRVDSLDAIRGIITKNMEFAPSLAPPGQATAPRITSLFQRVQAFIGQHPTAAIITAVVVVGLSAGLLASGIGVAVVAGAVLAVVAAGAVAMAATSLYMHIRTKRVDAAISALELSKNITSSEAFDLKAAFMSNSVAYKAMLEGFLARLNQKGATSSDTLQQLEQLLKHDKPDQFLEKASATLASLACLHPNCNRHFVPPLVQEAIATLPESFRQRVVKAEARNDLQECKNVLVEYYTTQANLAKAQENQKNNLVHFYTMTELALHFRSLKNDEALAHFARIVGQQKQLEQKSQTLETLIKALKALSSTPIEHEDEPEIYLDRLEQIQKDLHKLYTSYSETLKNYVPYTEGVDYTYASYFGRFNADFRILNDLLNDARVECGGRIHTTGHHFCAGCHFVDPTAKPEHKEFPLEPRQSAKVMNKQYIPVSRARYQLQAKVIKAYDEYIALMQKTLARYKLLSSESTEESQKFGKQSIEGMFNELMPSIPDDPVCKQVGRLRTRLAAMKQKLLEMQQLENKPSGMPSDLTSLGRKTVTAITCSFGTGHKTTAEALGRHIGARGAHFTVLDPSEDIFVDKVDTLHKVGKLFNVDWKATKVFNWILSKQLYWLVNIENRLDRFIRSAFNIAGKNGVAPKEENKDTVVKEILRKRLFMERPDLLVTTYHMDLNPALEVSQELGLPIMHVPTDLDVKAWEPFGKEPPAYRHFKCLLPDTHIETLASATPLMIDQLEPACIPLRPEFYTAYTQEEIAQLKRNRGIDPEAKVVLVLSGGGGQNVPYPDMFINARDNGKKYHVIVVAGANNDLGNGIKKQIKEGQRFATGSNPNVTVEVAEDVSMATDERKYFLGAAELAQLCAIADMGITKPGGLSIAELLQTGVPILADRRKTPMIWEDFNIEVIKRKGRGQAYVGDSAHFLQQVDEVIALGKTVVEDKTSHIVSTMWQMIYKAENERASKTPPPTH